MNSKLVFLIMLLVTGCGVKGDPTAPNTSPLPSLLENYPEVKTDKSIDEFAKRRR